METISKYELTCKLCFNINFVKISRINILNYAFSFVHLTSGFFFFRISSRHIVNSVCCSHALISGQTSQRPASDGGLSSGQLLMM